MRRVTKVSLLLLVCLVTIFIVLPISRNDSITAQQVTSTRRPPLVISATPRNFRSPTPTINPNRTLRATVATDSPLLPRANTATPTETARTTIIVVSTKVAQSTSENGFTPTASLTPTMTATVTPTRTLMLVRTGKANVPIAVTSTPIPTIQAANAGNPDDLLTRAIGNTVSSPNFRFYILTELRVSADDSDAAIISEGCGSVTGVTDLSRIRMEIINTVRSENLGVPESIVFSRVIDGKLYHRVYVPAQGTQSAKTTGWLQIPLLTVIFDGINVPGLKIVVDSTISVENIMERTGIKIEDILPILDALESKGKTNRTATGDSETTIETRLDLWDFLTDSIFMQRLVNVVTKSMGTSDSGNSNMMSGLMTVILTGVSNKPELTLTITTAIDTANDTVKQVALTIVGKPGLLGSTLNIPDDVEFEYNVVISLYDVNEVTQPIVVEKPAQSVELKSLNEFKVRNSELLTDTDEVITNPCDSPIQ